MPLKGGADVTERGVALRRLRFLLDDVLRARDPERLRKEQLPILEEIAIMIKKTEGDKK